MGQNYNAVCHTCRNTFILNKGGGFTHYLLVCANCGDTVSAPRRAPRGLNGTMNTSNIEKYLADKSKWTKDGPKFERSEEVIIQRILKRCNCSGEMLPEWDQNALRRCPECLSLDITSSPDDVVTD